MLMKLCCEREQTWSSSVAWIRYLKREFISFESVRDPPRWLINLSYLTSLRAVINGTKNSFLTSSLIRKPFLDNYRERSILPLLLWSCHIWAVVFMNSVARILFSIVICLMGLTTYSLFIWFSLPASI